MRDVFRGQAHRETTLLTLPINFLLLPHQIFIDWSAAPTSAPGCSPGRANACGGLDTSEIAEFFPAPDTDNAPLSICRVVS
jgi:hypothetical protein